VTLFRQHRIKGWRRHRTFLKPGGGLRYVRPDFVFAKERVMVMIDGCFWHGCPACYRQPKSNLRYWLPKIEANRHRDRTANQVLRKAGWTVIRIWEHQLTGTASRAIRRITTALESRTYCST